MKHNPSVVKAFFKSYGIPQPNEECKFHDTRKWRFDYSWILFEDNKDVIRVALEVEGAVWTNGRHTSGAGFVKDMEKYNSAACLGWRIIRCQPRELLTKATADMIRNALKL